MNHQRNILSLLAQVDPDIAENVRLEAVPGGFVNLTDLTVGDRVAALLSYGPKFLKPEDADIPEVFSGFGELHLQIERHIGIGITGPVFLELLDHYKDEKDRLFTIRQPSIMEAVIRQSVMEAKEFFRQYPEACIVQADKGNKTCLMLLTEYTSKMDAYVSKCVSKGVYRVVPGRRVQVVHKVFQELRNSLMKVKLPEGGVLTRLFSGMTYFRDAQLPLLYGTVKCHKPDAPLRPICSTVAWYSRPIQRILLHILKVYFGEALCRQNVVNLTEVVEKVVSIKPRPGYVFVKLDVTDMYGTMDKQRIIRLLDRLLVTIEEEGRSLLPRDLVRWMIRFSLEQSCLLEYGEEVYMQMIGLPQGACDSGFLATLYLDYVLQMHHEELFVSHRVQYWGKYMDDFLLYMPSRHISFFKQRMEYLTGLKFEVEHEEEITGGVYSTMGVTRTISFLDISIHTMKEGGYQISNYQKPIASMRMIHALSNTIFSYKTNAIQGRLNNLFTRTSNEFLVYDLDILQGRILANGYSRNLIECVFYKAITEEVNRMQQTSGRAQRTIEERKSILRDYMAQFSMDMEYHYQNIRKQYVALSKQPGYRFPYRSVSLSRLVFTACQYANMPPPVYCRAENSDVFRRYLGHKRVQEAMRTVENMPSKGANRRFLSVGMLRCITCGMVFVVSGRDKLHSIVEQEFRRMNSEISQHQERFQHTVSPAIQVLRSVKGVDTAYLSQLYLAIYQTMGLSTADRVLLSSFPTFVRALLYILRGAVVPYNEGSAIEVVNSTKLNINFLC